MKTKNHTAAAISVLCLSLLSACGGGGGDSSAPPGNPPSVALNASYDARVVGGSNDNFAITTNQPNCSATGNITTMATSAQTFETMMVLGASQTSTLTINSGSICPFEAGLSSGTTYYNASYSPIGLAVTGGEYAVFAAPPTDVPASATVGDTGTIVTLNTFTNNSKLVPTGTRIISYVIEADSVANIITRSFNTTNQLQTTQQSRYRVQNGTLTIITIEVRFETNPPLTLLYTKT